MENPHCILPNTNINTFVSWLLLLCICVCPVSAGLSRAESVEFICPLPEHLHLGYDCVGQGLWAASLWESKHANTLLPNGISPLILWQDMFRQVKKQTFWWVECWPVFIHPKLQKEILPYHPCSVECHSKHTIQPDRRHLLGNPWNCIKFWRADWHIQIKHWSYRTCCGGHMTFSKV